MHRLPEKRRVGSRGHISNNVTTPFHEVASGLWDALVVKSQSLDFTFKACRI